MSAKHFLAAVSALCLTAWLAGCGESAPNATTSSGSGDAVIQYDSGSAQDGTGGGDTTAAADAAEDAASGDTLAGAEVADAAADADTLMDAAQDAAADGAQDTVADSADAADTAAPSVPIAEFATATAEGLCKANFTTCTPEEKLPFATQIGCVASIGAANAATINELVADVLSGKLAYDGAKAAACIAEISATCDEMDLVDGPPACQGVFDGKLPNGAKCGYNVECASHFCFDPGNCASVCKARVKLGKACSEDDKCEAGAVCFGGLCVADVPKNVGAACGEVKCKSGLYCNTSSKCAPLNKLGAACDLDGSCELGSRCLLNGDVGKCEPMPKEGEACSPGIFSDQSVLCAAGLTCFNDGGESGTCEKLAAIGSPCTNSSNCGGWDVHCVGGAGNKTCQLLSTKGGPCQPGDLNMGEWGGCLAPYTCTKGICTDVPGLGQPCADDILNSCTADTMCDILDNVCIAMPALGETCYGICQDGLDCKLDSEGIQGVCVQATCN